MTRTIRQRAIPALSLCTFLCILGACAASGPGAVAQRADTATVAAPTTTGGQTVTVPTAAQQAGLERWLAGFRDRALAQGIAPATFDRAVRGIRYDPEVIARDRRQSEFTKTIWEYLDTAVSDTRIDNGRAALRDHAPLLDEIEARYGVEKEVVAAVWGLESSYGRFRGTHNVIEALATLAYDGRRGAFFEGQLIAALRILQGGDTTPERMTGSWAGAMGHTQFIPTSYLAYAVDFRGDGRRDIWSDDPTDALASTAAYLARHGWQTGRPWGIEVRLPAGFDFGLTGKGVRKSAAEWAALGVRPMGGGVLPDHGAGSILMPAGARGAAFLIFRNFGVIERYNAADAYVIAVGHLSDRLRGGPAIQTPWPRADRALSADERRELQELLMRAGYDTGGVDGRIGPMTVSAIRAYQRAAGLVADGYPSLDLLRRLRGA